MWLCVWKNNVGIAFIFISDEKNQLDATSVIYYHKLTLHVSSIYMLIFRSTGGNLLHLVFSTVRENKVCVVSVNLHPLPATHTRHSPAIRSQQPPPPQNFLPSMEYTTTGNRQPTYITHSSPHHTPALHQQSVPPTSVRTIRRTSFQYTRPRNLHQLLRDTEQHRLTTNTLDDTIYRGTHIWYKFLL
jgi:hypothetical protein